MPQHPSPVTQDTLGLLSHAYSGYVYLLFNDKRFCKSGEGAAPSQGGAPRDSVHPHRLSFGQVRLQPLTQALSTPQRNIISTFWRALLEKKKETNSLAKNLVN